MSEAPVTPAVSPLSALVEKACRFNCDAESSCTCYAHELYRAALSTPAPQPDKLLRDAFVAGWQDGFVAADPTAIPRIYEALEAWPQHEPAFVEAGAAPRRAD